MTHARDPSKPGYYLAANGALMMLAGLLVGLTVSSSPYPRLMLAAHTQLLVNGMMSVFAGLLLKASFSIVGKRTATVIVAAHVSTWLVGLTEIAGTFWGTKKALPIAASQAGAPGGEPWQESLVKLCHEGTGLLLILAWILLAWGVYAARNEQSAPPAA